MNAQQAGYYDYGFVHLLPVATALYPNQAASVPTIKQRSGHLVSHLRGNLTRGGLTWQCPDGSVCLYPAVHNGQPQFPPMPCRRRAFCNVSGHPNPPLRPLRFARIRQSVEVEFACEPHVRLRPRSYFDLQTELHSLVLGFHFKRQPIPTLRSLDFAGRLVMIKS